MMLDHLGQTELGDVLLKSIEDTIAEGVKTRDLGGTSNTQEVINHVITKIKSY
jgi:tartrate dehydrogenase/decarboxylase/D-malate dehydrogenase